MQYHNGSTTYTRVLELLHHAAAAVPRKGTHALPTAGSTADSRKLRIKLQQQQNKDALRLGSNPVAVGQHNQSESELNTPSHGQIGTSQGNPPSSHPRAAAAGSCYWKDKE